MGRTAVPRRLIERRIHQDAMRAPRQASCRNVGFSRSFDIQADGASPIGEPVLSNIVAGQRNENRIHIDERDLQVGHPQRQRQTGCPDSGAEISRLFPRYSAGGRREQDGVMPDPMTTARLPQRKPATKDGVVCRGLRGHSLGDRSS
jgi:hypothetical protein